MGYIAPAPSGIIVLPENITYANIEAFRKAGEHPRLSVLAVPDFGLQVIGGPDPAPPDPRGWAERYTVHFGYGLLASIGALVLSIAWMVGR